MIDILVSNLVFLTVFPPLRDLLQLKVLLEGHELFLKILDSEACRLVVLPRDRLRRRVKWPTASKASRRFSEGVFQGLLSVGVLHIERLHHQPQRHHLILNGFDANLARQFLAVEILAHRSLLLLRQIRMGLQRDKEVT